MYHQIRLLNFVDANEILLQFCNDLSSRSACFVVGKFWQICYTITTNCQSKVIMSSHTHHCHRHNVYHEHDHDPKTRLEEARHHCVLKGVRFTLLREQVYELILTADKPMGAYDLISALQAKRQDDADSTSKNIAPPTVYRSLEFLLEEGLIHQLNSINAYIPCCHPRSAHAAAFLICTDCHKVEECSNLPVQSILDFATQDANFQVERTMIELKGLCHDCQKNH